MARVPDADINRSRRMGGPGRQLEAGCPPSRSSHFEQALLHREVAGIGGFSHLVERPRERDRKRTAEGNTE